MSSSSRSGGTAAAGGGAGGGAGAGKRIVVYTLCVGVGVRVPHNPVASSHSRQRSGATCTLGAPCNAALDTRQDGHQGLLGAHNREPEARRGVPRAHLGRH